MTIRKILHPHHPNGGSVVPSLKIKHGMEFTWQTARVGAVEVAVGVLLLEAMRRSPNLQLMNMILLPLSMELPRRDSNFNSHSHVLRSERVNYSKNWVSTQVH